MRDFRVPGHILKNPRKEMKGGIWYSQGKFASVVYGASIARRSTITYLKVDEVSEYEDIE